MSMTSESEEKLALKNDVNSPTLDEANSVGGYEGRNGPLKKGPWTIAEDAILVEYVTKHGEGNWNAIQKHTELARCGKSCRLRWTNHLRPDLKKGAFTPEEERRVVELHAKMGNKWARMVAELPGRTDNEIKNFWNTRIKRRQRAGLPIYPPDISPEALNENQQNDINTLSPDFMQNNNFEIPALEFKNLELNQQQLYPPQLLNVPSSSLMAQNLDSSYPNDSFLSTLHPSKRLKGSNCLFLGLNAAFGNFLPNGSQYHNAQPFIMLPSTYDNQNANISSSEKLELPSFQCQLGRWGSPSSPLTSRDPVNILTQPPQKIQQSQSCDLSTRSSGLLEEVLYESKIMKNASDVAVVDVIDNSSHDLYETEWEANSELVSLPLVFSGNSLDEHQPIGTAPGGKSKATPTSLFPTQSVNEPETPSQNIISRPDMLLGSNCFKDTNAMLLGDDLSQRYCKKRDTSSLVQGHQNDSCASMHSVYSLVPQFDDEM